MNVLEFVMGKWRIILIDINIWVKLEVVCSWLIVSVNSEWKMCVIVVDYEEFNFLLFVVGYFFEGIFNRYELVVEFVCS